MKNFIIFWIRAYQILVSPCLSFLCGPGCGCRFTPTCSQYCLEAVTRHGCLHGLFLGLRRLLRCQPWGGNGYDPVPELPAKGQRPDGEERGRFQIPPTPDLSAPSSSQRS